ncbi:MAG: PepSY domain-containing protein [Chitinophagaceae bacterium]|nr:MAG: PepSY domain-containing protein [Chitinophagaceae bacterium]
MNLRNYNIYFHTHTISGIIISLVMYVIFFAGSFAFFKSQVSHWQHNNPDRPLVKEVDYDRMLDSVGREFNLYGREVSFYSDPHSSTVYFYGSQSKDTLVKGEALYFDIDASTFNRQKGVYEEAYDLGEFLYRLHFLAQIPYPYGYFIAGAVAFILLFAILTGILVHWQKIVSNFYVFRPWEKLKTLWTDLHTALGVISLPFMLLFAVTGAYFLINIPLFNDPVLKYRFGGNADSLTAVAGGEGHNVPFNQEKMDRAISFNEFAGKARQIWGPEAVVNHVEAINYGDRSMQVHVAGIVDPSEKFAGGGELVFDAASGAVLERRDPDAPLTYSEISTEVLTRLHFASYGGMATKFLYFLLGISGCFVVVSGVMIWLVARDKTSVPEYKRKFNSWLVNIYLAVSLAMLPVTAAAFIAVKFNPEGGMYFIYKFYFIAWLLVSLPLVIRKNIYKTNRDTLLAGAVIGYLVPVVNGFLTGNWFWKSFRTGYHDVFLIDALWILVASIALFAWRRVVSKEVHGKGIKRGRGGFEPPTSQ